LGNRLYNGQGIIKNYAEAAKWYRKSAENGNQNAQYNLGWCYQYGQGVTKNLTEAKKWYQKAADKGYESAKKKLVELNQ
jgi:TPR repeat protein